MNSSEWVERMKRAFSEQKAVNQSGGEAYQAIAACAREMTAASAANPMEGVRFHHALCVVAEELCLAHPGGSPERAQTIEWLAVLASHTSSLRHYLLQLPHPRSR